MQAAELRNDPFRRITVTPYTGTFGAEISDVDLNNIDEETTAEIREALLRYNVVFFQGQEFTPESQAAFVRRFGTLNRHPYVKGIDGHPDVFRIVKEPTDKHHFGNGWHTDLSYTETPAMGTVLYGMQVPEAGGDTMYASTVAAYEALDEGMKKMLDGVKAVYTNANTYGKDAKRFQDGVSKAMNVVAAEVKELASQTGKATGEIQQQIDAIRGATDEAVSAIGEIQVTIGEISQSVTDVSAAVTEQSFATQSIAENTQRAAGGTSKVSDDISEVRSMSEQARDSANMFSRSVTELSEQADHLDREVKNFLGQVRSA